MPTNTDGLNITTQLTRNMLTCRFSLGAAIHDGDTVFFHNKEDAKDSPLAENIFAINGIEAVKVSKERVDVTRDSFEDWPSVTRVVGKLLREQAASKKPAVKAGVAANMPTPDEIRKKAQKVLEEEINPSVASHGGVITLLDVKDATIYVKLGGGCQGCGMADVTLKQGVEKAFRASIPEIDDILDITDHAAGSNPYYAPSTK